MFSAPLCLERRDHNGRFRRSHRPNAELAPVVAEQFATVTDVAGAAEPSLELVAADTYLAAMPLLEAPEAIELAGSIVDQQHQSILLFVLGEYPGPDVFQKADESAA